MRYLFLIIVGLFPHIGSAHAPVYVERTDEQITDYAITQCFKREDRCKLLSRDQLLKCRNVDLLKCLFENQETQNRETILPLAEHQMGAIVLALLIANECSNRDANLKQKLLDKVDKIPRETYLGLKKDLLDQLPAEVHERWTATQLGHFNCTEVSEELKDRLESIHGDKPEYAKALSGLRKCAVGETLGKQINDLRERADAGEADIELQGAILGGIVQKSDDQDLVLAQFAASLYRLGVMTQEEYQRHIARSAIK